MKNKFLQSLFYTTTWIVFAIYLYVVIHYLFMGHRYMLDIGMGSVNLTPFSTIKQYIFNYENYNFNTWFNNLFGNVLLFVPMGFLLPIVLRWVNSYWKIFIIGVAIVFGLEFTQLVTRRGSFDIDDIILNSLGILVGYTCYRLIRFIIGYQNKRR